MQQNDVLLHHVMRMTLMSLDILEQHSVIAPSDVSSIRGKLQTVLATSPPHQPQSLQTSANAPAPGMFHGHTDQGAPPALPPRQNSPYSVDDSQLDRAVALWDYGGSAPDDLNFRKDDVIVIDQEINPEWYRGHLQNDPTRRSALFPHNYVQKLPKDNHPYPSSSPMPSQSDINEKQAMMYGTPPSAYPMHPQGPPLPQQWQGPPPPGPMYGGPPQQPGAMLPYNPPPPPQQQMPPPQQNGQAPAVPGKKPHKFGKVGGQLGNSFVNGTGFGAGAAIGSGIVNAIF